MKELLFFYENEPVELTVFISSAIDRGPFNPLLERYTYPVFCDGHAMMIQYYRPRVLSLGSMPVFKLFGFNDDLAKFTPDQWKERMILTTEMKKIFFEEGCVLLL